tara:strand:+ start:31898 stop:34063 length:2166 start_codon:yes stop_codon:yes gene_type:complete
LNILILIINIFLSIIYADDYIWPNDYNGNITATFSEPRARRFHAGIDVRTFGEIGSNLYAIESGHIQRIKISPNSYGKAIYLKLNDNNVVLYSHLNDFNNEIENLVNQLYIKYQSSFFDHILTQEQQIKINKGDIIGYTGDTGSLSGPHLHFEIRNQNNEPMNPLDYYDIKDSTPPLAKSITIIPLSNRTWINGIQDYKNFEIKKINSNKYVLEDTISVIGEFGIALETYDEIDNLSFKYGIYKIDLLLDNILTYSIQFDNYSFSEDHLIYTAIDYPLLKEGNISHRLFNSTKDDLSFIKSSNNGKLIIDNKTHNIIINIYDINNNVTQIQAVLIGENLNNLDINVDNETGTIKINQLLENEIFLNVTSKYNDVENYISDFTKITDTTFKINNYNKDLDIIEYYIKNKSGIKSRKSFLNLQNQNPYNIKGKINTKHLDAGLIIEFHEEEFSGYNPKLEIISNGVKREYLLYRKDKNILSSKIINIDNLEKMSIIYDTKPEIIFNKDVTTLSSEHENEIEFNKYKIKSTENSFYNKTLIICSENKSFNFNKKISNISRPITIEPDEVPFKKEIQLDYNIKDCNNCGFYKFSDNDQKWNYINTKYSSNKITTNITNGGTFCILQESKAPNITNLIPAINSTYKKTNFKKIKFNVEDILSGVDPYSIEIKIDGKKIFFDYIKYRNLVIAKLNQSLDIGKHIIEVVVSDNVNNKNSIKGEFIIIE